VAQIETVFKAYDIRGTVPDQLDAELCRAIGAAFARLMADESGATRMLICRDMRPSGVEFTAAFAEGVNSQGLDVVDLGMGSTDMLYFAAGHYNAPGAMLTASHNPAIYNGIKLCRAGARPVGMESGLADIKRMVIAGEPKPADTTGTIKQENALDAFVKHVHSFTDLSVLRPLKVVADTANGMGGLVVPAVFSGLPFELDILYPELDGTFPNHPADPIQPENQRDLQARVLETGADVGLAFDGDADRVFLVDNEANLISGSITTAMVAKFMLEKNPGAAIVYNVVCSKTVREVIDENGGKGIRSRVGHSFIKQLMNENNAAFGGEHSAHYYFRDNYFADSGIIAAMIVLGMLSASGQPLSEYRRPFDRYVASGEINTHVADASQSIAAVESAFAGAQKDHLDGLTVDNGDWWFSLRSSNTEPVLRLNLEAKTRAECDEYTRSILDIIKGA
jgi:phosphomannomutase